MACQLAQSIKDGPEQRWRERLHFVENDDSRLRPGENRIGARIAQIDVEILTIALILAYVFLSETLGFIPIAVAILLVLFLRQEVKLPTALVTAVATAIVIHIAFADFLRVPLPRGLLDRVLW